MPSSSNPAPITRAVPRKLKTVTTSIPVPNDLIVPKDFKASVDRTQAPPVLPDEKLHMKGSAPDYSNTESGGIKKMDDGGNGLEPPPKMVRSLEPSKPAPLPRPPLKRTKEPQSIFIPKKKVTHSHSLTSSS